MLGMNVFILSVPSKVFELGPILLKFTKFWEFLHQNDSFKAENCFNQQQKKASFLHIFTKSVEPIFQSFGPISRHTALEGTLMCIELLCSLVCNYCIVCNKCARNKQGGGPGRTCLPKLKFSAKFPIDLHIIL